MDTNNNTSVQTGNSVKKTILIVDDTKENLIVIGGILKAEYHVRVVTSGEQALRAVTTQPRPDLILLDVMMPAMDGYTVLKHLKQNSATDDIPVIFVTAMDADKDEEYGLSLGAVDYITKPVSPAILLARVKTHLDLKQNRDALQQQNEVLESAVLARTRALKTAMDKLEKTNANLNKAYFSTLLAMGEVCAVRSHVLGEHSQRVAHIVRRAAPQLGMSDKESQDVFVAALLHDLGMIGLDDDALQQPVNSLSGQALANYRRHPETGARIVRKIEGMESVVEIIRHHHENYNGTGFPDGLSGLNIPLGARLIAAVSDYDDLVRGGLTSKPMSYKESFQYLLEQRGLRYDPIVVDTLEAILSADWNFEIDEIRVPAKHLLEGMMISRDVYQPSGPLLLSKGTVLTRNLINNLVDVQNRLPSNLEIYVMRQRVNT